MISALGYSKNRSVARQIPRLDSTAQQKLDEKSLGETQPLEKTLPSSLGEAQPLEKPLGYAQPLEKTDEKSLGKSQPTAWILKKPSFSLGFHWFSIHSRFRSSRRADLRFRLSRISFGSFFVS